MPKSASHTLPRTLQEVLPLSPPNEGPGPRVIKACVPCARLKVKCENEPGANVCKRCRRLGKLCTVQQPGSQTHKKLKKSSTVARLEEKLDGVAAILAASERDRERMRGGDQPETSDFPPHPALLSPTTCLEQHIKDETEAQLILDAFRNDMAPFFPFVVIPPAMTVDQLKRKNPFLLLSAMMVGCRHDKVRQMAMAKAFRELVSHRILVKGEQSLDLLQSLLVYIAWYHLHIPLGPQLTNLVHLAMAMVSDLGLHRPAQMKLWSRPPGTAAMGYFVRDGQVPAARTLAERRAFLGCFCITFIVSMFARDIEHLRYSQYAEECCRVISDTMEYSSDTYLVKLTELCHFGDRISRTLKFDDWEWSSGIAAPLGACVRSLEAELHQLKASFTLGPSQSAEIRGQRVFDHAGLLAMHYYSIEIYLYEIALGDNVDPARYGNFPMTRLNLLFACLNSTKSCMETFFSLPTLVYFDMPFLFWALVGHAIVVTSKLNLFVGDGWDQVYVRSVLDFPTTVDTIAANMDAAKAAAELSVHVSGCTPSALPRTVPEFFAGTAPKLQFIKEVHETRRSGLARSDQAQNVSNFDEPSPQYLPENEPNGHCLTTWFDFLDEDFWRAFT
ncbi:Transcription factor opdL [Exophiala dermatitidis]|uniref:Zn(2)-C6 fungal-type domain-containing protein n=1 Tax=Exophiala dermatitidis (strain ATCC 34100 / CBS 525.76 / NIH/UT8656) TaxID=858893 RepID=H6C095_EXODN|nr:uncharacterized protein HMPREF1120_05237 [Exophiala dermatitidis NIH/UT8656]XP_009157651.1 hypothetical protein, variant [Exophiala dermatitidis NIH/UT8656]EHY57189.1 hypothetical protein, variant [Exophiala dermatitidis NIH/UT8656]EHY57190.1 hypothetical protein HMPREF1120_05237 [Exophiala dermatitidis NIH/UT8656]